MPGIYDPNQTFDAGLAFNYNVWSPGTTITLTNVPWNNDYRDIVNFGSTAALDTWINQQLTDSVTVENVAYARPNMPIQLDIPFNFAYRYNYLRASNPAQPTLANDQAKSFYYFITDVQYVNPDTTRFLLQLDVWQTFGYEVTFGNCYIESGHIGIANENSFSAYGRDYLNIPEGLDVGGEYRTIKIFSDTVMSPQYGMNILVMSATDLEVAPGTISAPNLTTSTGDSLQGMPSGASAYIFNSVSEFQQFMASYAGYPWITNGILSITAIPEVSRYNYSTYTVSPPGQVGSAVTFHKLSAGQFDSGVKNYTGHNWRNDASVRGWIPQRYAGLLKFLTYPYMIIEMTAFNGPPTILKPESWQDPDGLVTEKISLLPPGQRIVVYPNRYNAANDSTNIVTEAGSNTTYDDMGDYLDTNLQISNFPTFAIVNDNAVLYLANNAHSVSQQYRQADWSQQRALQGNQAAYQNSQEQSALTSFSGQNQRYADYASTEQQNRTAAYQALTNGGMDIAKSLEGGTPVSLAGGALSAAGEAANYAIGVNANNSQWAIRNNASQGQSNASLAAMNYTRDTNKNYADYAARGDYQMSVAAINAKVQDSMMAQPSTSGQIGGEAFNAINGGQQYSIRWKLIPESAIRTIGEYWLRYGYAVRQFSQMPPSLMVMTNFTYWKLQETYITAARIPEQFKQTIRGIFEKGVTVWTDPGKIGNIDIADNQPLSGIVLSSGAPTTAPVTTPTTTETDDEMPKIINIVVNGANNYYAIGAEYCRLMNEEGISAPTALLGGAYITNTAAAQGLFLMLGIPTEYADPATFSAAWPGHVWSRAKELELYVEALQTGGARTVTDGVTNSGNTAFSSATANFTTADIGASITGAGIPANTTIATLTDNQNVTMSNAATVTATGVSVTITDAKNAATTTAVN